MWYEKRNLQQWIIIHHQHHSEILENILNEISHNIFEKINIISDTNNATPENFEDFKTKLRNDLTKQQGRINNIGKRLKNDHLLLHNKFLKTRHDTQTQKKL